MDVLQKRGKLKEEVSSFEKWDETLDQIAKRVTKNPQQFENKAEVLRRFLEGEREYGEKLTLAVKVCHKKRKEKKEEKKKEDKIVIK